MIFDGWEIVRLTWMLQHRLFHSAQDDLESLSLTAKSISILGILEFIHNPSEIAKSISAPLPTVSNLLKDLELSGLVSRTASIKDRRKVAYARTEQGDQALKRGIEVINQKSSSVLGALDEAELQELFRLLNKLSTHK
jgi:DNA-binding MarR family transcriptional regulator